MTAFMIKPTGWPTSRKAAHLVQRQQPGWLPDVGENHRRRRVTGQQRLPVQVHGRVVVDVHDPRARVDRAGHLERAEQADPHRVRRRLHVALPLAAAAAGCGPKHASASAESRSIASSGLPGQ
jgi:hypothetical protein